MNADKLKRGGMDTRKMSDVERQEADRQLLGSEILVMTGNIPSKHDTVNQCRFNVGPTSEDRANIKLALV